MQAGPNLTLLNLPAEILQLIFNWLPNDCFVGSNNIQRTAKIFEVIAAANRQVNSVKAILDNCYNEEDALRILSNQGILQYLTLQEMLTVASFNPALASMVLAKITSDNAKHIPLLTQRNEPLAIQAWENRQRWDDNLNWGALGRPHPALANRILNEFLGLSQFEALRLFEKYNADWFAQLAEINLGIAQRITNNVTLSKAAGLESIKAIMRSHLEVAKKLFRPERPSNFRVFVGAAVWHLETAQQIMALPEILTVLTEREIIVMGRKYETLARTFMASRRHHGYAYNLALVQIAPCYEWMAREIMADVALFNSLNGAQLAQLAQNHEFVWQKIENDQTLLNKLSVTNLALAGSRKLAIAKSIIEMMIFIEFTAEDIGLMTQDNVAIALAVLKEFHCYTLIPAENLGVLFKSHAGVAKKMLDSPHWQAHIVANPAAFISEGLPIFIIEKLLTLPGVIAKLGPNELTEITYGHPSLQHFVCQQSTLTSSFDNQTGEPFISLMEGSDFYQFLLTAALELRPSLDSPGTINTLKPTHTQQPNILSLFKMPAPPLAPEVITPEPGSLLKRKRG